jgi:hypothetical protein
MLYSGAWGKLIQEKKPEVENLVALSLEANPFLLFLHLTRRVIYLSLKIDSLNVIYSGRQLILPSFMRIFVGYLKEKNLHISHWRKTPTPHF